MILKNMNHLDLGSHILRIRQVDYHPQFTDVA